MNKEQIEKMKIKMLDQIRKKKEERLVELWCNMEPFNNIDDIPDIPIIKNPELYKEVIVKNLIRCGAIPKDELEVGKEYEGTCRNATMATWNGTEFEYKRCKWGKWFTDTINHFEDDNGYDLFVPLNLAKERINLKEK